MIIHKKYHIDEGCLDCLIFWKISLLVNVFLFQEIYKEIKKLYDMLVEYLDGNYLDAEMIDTKLVREVTFKVFANKEISNNYKKSYQKSKS